MLVPAGNPSRHTLAATLLILGALTVRTALADAATDAAGSDQPALQTVTIVAAGVSNMDAASAGDINHDQLMSQPLLRPGAVLENVPGLIVTQHSGEGKANQYFLRAFNLDHGTDLATEVDNMPINMPTHAHGQGYTDLNFVIPELVSDLHYKKGPYYADEGDFATAGAVRMDLLNQVPVSATLGYGEDGYRRALLLGSAPLGTGTLLGGADLYHNDGPFDYPDDYHRVNGVLRYSRGGPADLLTLTAMAYSGDWNATDQVPAHAITQGVIGRFGSLNPSDGGASSRYSLAFNRVLRSDADQLQFSAYVIRYKLDLWSTFTYYLQDPVYGDQMLQHDDRVVYGFNGSKSWFTQAWGKPTTVLLGLQGRLDDIRDVAIAATVQRQHLATKQDAGVTESNLAAYLEASTAWSAQLRTVLGLRDDQFWFNVTDKMRSAAGGCDLTSDPLGCNSGDAHANLASPKLGIILGPWGGTSYFINLAEGYHSNDARGITRSGANPEATPVTPLTRAVAGELGLTATPLPRWQATLDVFLLKLRSELVFDGDAGVTSPSGATTRTGIESGNTYRINRWLQADLNAAFSRARFDQDTAPDDLGCADAAPSHPCAAPIAIVGRYIPNSPTNVIDAGLTAQHPSGWLGTVKARHFGAAPLTEDNAARSPAYTTVDLQLGYQHPGKWLVAADVFNLFDVKWNDIEYYYASRLQNEAYATPDFVVHPGVPRTVRIHFQYFL